MSRYPIREYVVVLVLYIYTNVQIDVIHKRVVVLVLYMRMCSSARVIYANVQADVIYRCGRAQSRWCVSEFAVILSLDTI